MRHIRSSIEIHAPGDAIWHLIADFGQWPRWGPTVTDVRSSSDSVSPGVTGSLRTPVGLWLPFVITEVDHGVSWSWKVAGIKATGHELTSAAGGCSRLEFSAPWYWAPYRPVLWSGLRNVRSIAEDESGRFVP